MSVPTDKDGPTGDWTLKDTQKDMDSEERQRSERFDELSERDKSFEVQKFIYRTRAFKRKLSEFGRLVSSADEVQMLASAIGEFSLMFYDFLDSYSSLCSFVGPAAFGDSNRKYMEDFESRGDSLIIQAESRLSELSSERRKSVSGTVEKDKVAREAEIGASLLDANKELIGTLTSQLTLSRLPSPEPSVFTGDPMSYIGWKKSFEVLISSRSVPEAERIHYLKRYLGGDAKSCVECYLSMGTAEAFVAAFKNLDQRYGNPFVVGESYRDKLQDWPKIQNKDAQGLRSFVDFLRQLEVGMMSLPSLKFLDDPRENRKILLKLPDWLVQRWRRIVNEWTVGKGNFPPFSCFVDLLYKESEIANEPFTLLSGPSKSENAKSGDGFRDRGSSVPKKEKGTSHAVKSPRCLFCEETHWLSKCKSFLDRSEAEKKSFVYKHKLCFGCLAPGHLSKKCRRKSTCDICSNNHPTAMHKDVQGYLAQNIREAGQVVRSELIGVFFLQADAPAFVPSHSGATSTSTGSLSAMIVPVYVSHSDNPSRERLVYALLDTQSDTSLWKHLF